MNNIKEIKNMWQFFLIGSFILALLGEIIVFFSIRPADRNIIILLLLFLFLYVIAFIFIYAVFASLDIFFNFKSADTRGKISIGVAVVIAVLIGLSRM